MLSVILIDGAVNHLVYIIGQCEMKLIDFGECRTYSLFTGVQRNNSYTLQLVETNS